MGQSPHAKVPSRGSHWSHWYFYGKMSMSPGSVTPVGITVQTTQPNLRVRQTRA